MNEHWSEKRIRRGEELVARLVRIIKENGYIGGSFAAWAVSEEHCPFLPTDIDIFAVSDEAVPDLVDGIIKDLGGYFIDGSVSNERVVTLQSTELDERDIQIIRPSPEWKTFPDDVLNSFDLDICRAVIISPVSAWADTNAGKYQAKVLRVNNPLRTLKRVLKYRVRDVQFSDHELLKLFRAWEEWPEDRRQAALTAAAEEAAEDGIEDVLISDFVDDDDWFEGE